MLCWSLPSGSSLQGLLWGQVLPARRDRGRRNERGKEEGRVGAWGGKERGKEGRKDWEKLKD